MNEAASPRRRDGFQFEVLDGEAVLFEVATLRIMHLNQSAALIWQLCDGSRTVAEIRDMLVAAYPDAAPTIPSDLYSALTRLIQTGALALAQLMNDESSIH